MHYFNYKGKKLYCEGVRVGDLAEKYGTPLFIYSHRTLTEHYRKLDGAFTGVPHLICYSVKANDNLSILSSLHRMGSGFDIVSGGELYKVLRVGADPEKIVYAGVGKTAEEIQYALRSGVLMFNIESQPEAENIQRCARALGRRARIAIRVNPDVAVDTHHYITTGKKGTKFGVALDSVKGLLRHLSKMSHLDVTGIHFHLGSQITETAPYVAAVERAAALVRDIREMGIPITSLNLGGGMGIIYDEERPATASKLAHAILPILKTMGVRILLEPGRFIVGSAGILVTRVLYLKESGKKQFVIVDGGMNDLIRPSLYQAFHRVVPLETNGSESRVVDVVGPICESGDYFARDRSLPTVDAGDLLAVMGAGAYGSVMSSNYNSRRRSAEVMVRGRKSWVVRERERYEDLVRGQAVFSELN